MLLRSRSAPLRGRNLLLALLPLFLLLSVANAVAQDCFTDQSQEFSDYGFNISDTYDRWQEFVPQRAHLCRVEFVIDRRGTPSGLDVTIEDADGNVLWIKTTTIPQTGTYWHSLEIDPPVVLVPETSHKLRLRGLDPWPDPANTMFWPGQVESSYDRGVTDTAPGWADYDYKFRILTSVTVPTASVSWGTVKARFR